MKISVDQKVLLDALERGAVAALSKESQGDVSNLSMLLRSVKITVDNNFTVESSSSLLAVKYTIPIVDGCGIEVKEHGQIMIPAKEFMTWVEKQPKAKIGIILAKLDAPEEIKVRDNNDVQKTIKKIGTVKFASKDSSKTGNRWALDCYDALQAPTVDFSAKPDTLFEVSVEQVLNGIKHISIASLDRHHEHIFDSFMFEVSQGFLHMVATDATRCASYKLDKDVVLSDSMMESNGANKVRLLIPEKILSLTSSLFDKSGKIVFSYDSKSKENRLFISQPNFEFRVAVSDPSVSKKFPSVEMLLNKKYKQLCTISKEILLSRVISASMVNKSTILFKFSKVDSTLSIKAISDGGLSPSMSIAPVSDLSEDKAFVWAVTHIVDVVKLVKDENFTFYVPERDNGSFKVVSPNAPNFSYFAMSVTNSKYNAEI